MKLKISLLFVPNQLQLETLCRKEQFIIAIERRSQIIKFAELNQVLEERRRVDQKIILAHLKRLGEVGARNAAVVDTTTGLVQGAAGAILIDEALLPKIEFIREGHFSENPAAPALKLVGSVQKLPGVMLQPIREIVSTKAIRTPDIFLVFFEQDFWLPPRRKDSQRTF